MELWGPYKWPYLNRVTGIVITSISGVVALYITGFGACLVASKGDPQPINRQATTAKFIYSTVGCNEDRHHLKLCREFHDVFLFGGAEKTYPKHETIFLMTRVGGPGK